MDSMRALNTSLPSSQPSRAPPPEQLLQAFRTAALSVTNLYKAAAVDQANTRQAGYQDALEDLLKFLDQENLGLQDGEGWKIRQWATERFDPPTRHQPHTETDDDSSDVETRQQVSSPTPEVTEQISPGCSAESQRPDEDNASNINEPPPIFHFTANHSDHAMQTGEASPVSESEASSSSQTPPVRVELLQRSNRLNVKPRASRHNTRSNQQDFNFTAGTKRKLQFPDFFDISNIHDRRDNVGGGGGGGGGGSKRGRFI